MHSSRMRTTCSLTVSRRILCMPPGNHACLPATKHVPPVTMHAPQQPHMPPATMHAPCNYACPPGNHACHPQQPCMPPINNACPPTTTDPLATTHAPAVNRMTNRCKSITGRARLIRSHSSARFCFELSGNSN